MLPHWTAAVDHDPHLPTVRSVARTLSLVEHVDWTWEQRADGTWWLVVAAHHGDVLAAALEERGYTLDWYERHGLPIHDRVLVAALTRRLAPLLPDVPWTHPLVTTALLQCPADAPLYRDEVGRWLHTDQGRPNLRVEVYGQHPSWCAAVPGVYYERDAAIVGLERAYGVARALVPVAPSLAVSLLRAHWIDAVDVPSDTDLLCRAPNLAALSPDLQKLVGRIAGRVPSSQNFALRDYQQIAVAFAVACKGRALIGDAPGVGKTASALGFLLADPAEHTPALVVAPASVLTNWVDETNMWSRGSLRPQIIDKNTNLVKLGGAVWITSWTGMTALDPALVTRLGIRTLILDEAHYAKHADSQRSQAALQIANLVPFVLALTGTPLENRTSDLHGILTILGYDVGDWTQFKARYGPSKRKVIRGVGYVDDTQQALLPELRDVLRGVMLRRLKSDCAMQLPDKTRVNVWVDLPDAVRRAYDEAEQHVDRIIAAAVRKRRARHAAKLLDQGHGIANAVHLANQLDLQNGLAVQALAIVVLGHMRQLVAAAKLPSALAWIKEFRANTGEPLVVFHAHRKVRIDLVRMLEGTRGLRVRYIDGTVPADQRGAIVRDFQAGRIDVLLCMLRSANIGITLHRASTVLFVERGLVAAGEEQAEDRVWRSGQKNACTAYYLMARNTVDERLEAIAVTKRRLGNDVLRGETVGEAVGEHDGASHEAEAIFLSAVEAALAAGGIEDTTITVADVRAVLREVA